MMFYRGSVLQCVMNLRLCESRLSAPLMSWIWKRLQPGSVSNNTCRKGPNVRFYRDKQSSVSSCSRRSCSGPHPAFFFFHFRTGTFFLSDLVWSPSISAVPTWQIDCLLFVSVSFRPVSKETEWFCQSVCFLIVLFYYYLSAMGPRRDDIWL